jgi:hypothetical protein
MIANPTNPESNASGRTGQTAGYKKFLPKRNKDK